MEIDHVFICVPKGAPQANQLLQLGILEGPPNRHPGQGTACRRFYFENAMLELLWVESETEAKASPTGLWERWYGALQAGGGVSPFGIILRPRVEGELPAAPFAHWVYQPETMPGLRLWIASETSLEEPMWCVMPERPTAPARPSRPAHHHPAGMRELTGVRLHSPAHFNLDPQAFAGDRIDWRESASEHWLELEFDGKARGRSADLRPDLPVALYW